MGKKKKKNKKKKRLKKGIRLRIGKSGLQQTTQSIKDFNNKKDKEKTKKVKVEYSPSIAGGKIISQGVVMSKYHDCTHPVQAKAGKHEITMIGWRDFTYKKHAKLVKGLDVFIGLTDSFDTHELFKREYENPLLQSLSIKFHEVKEKLKNMIVLEITDGSYDTRVLKIAISLLDKGKLIGFGCLGAHGRTGWLYAGLIKHYEKVSGDTAVKRARERYCERMVETKQQIKQLGCKKVKGSYQVRGFGDDVTVLDDFDIPVVSESATSPFSRQGFTDFRSTPVTDQMEAWEKEFGSKGVSGDISDTGVVKDTVEDEENPDQVVKVETPESIVLTQALNEAYHKDRLGEPLSEEEERLIEEDMYRLIGENEA